ncbi:hypothetical protein LTR56_017614 [Elasticomyces elasticus]|nr:hypothetical protein LTR22_026095 [Elasticomyces elasticus]KAK3630200.1 hypothetical protein LTR56_017614 [Elasticomyces elasticus]KAK4903983.1 hypothetical protein LTR49_026485 [Elasticomyces elasticus]KAK5757763.1 hypothetical protein LTS12_012081 [Elasticomyces elasticus]
MATSAHRVANIPELLELIIYELPESNILTSTQRVSKAFRTVINGSLPIQRKLFFLPESPNGQPRINRIFLNPHFFDQQIPLAINRRIYLAGQDCRSLPGCRHLTLQPSALIVKYDEKGDVSGKFVQVSLNASDELCEGPDLQTTPPADIEWTMWDGDSQSRGFKQDVACGENGKLANLIRPFSAQVQYMLRHTPGGGERSTRGRNGGEYETV